MPTEPSPDRAGIPEHTTAEPPRQLAGADFAPPPLKADDRRRSAYRGVAATFQFAEDSRRDSGRE